MREREKIFFIQLIIRYRRELTIDIPKGGVSIIYREDDTGERSALFLVVCFVVCFRHVSRD